MAANINPKNYKWFEYKGRKVELRSPTFIIEMSKGSIFGIKKTSTGWIYVDPDLDAKVKFDDFDGQRLIQNSKGWSGKVSRYNVEAGEGGLDVKVVDHKQQDDLIVIPADSSNLKRIVYAPARKSLFIEFRSGDMWRYDKVSQKEADAFNNVPSQGCYFYYAIRNKKPQAKVKAIK